MPSPIDTDAFPQYVVETNETGDAFYIFVLVYTVLAFMLIAPLVSLGKHFAEIRNDIANAAANGKKEGAAGIDGKLADGDEHAPMEHKSSDTTNKTASVGHSSLVTEESAEQQPQQPRQEPQPPLQRPQAFLQPQPRSQRSLSIRTRSQVAADRGPQPQGTGDGARRASASGAFVGIMFRGLDRVAGAGYPDANPDFASQISGTVRKRRNTTTRTVVSRAPSSAVPSGAPSVATTSRLRSSKSNRSAAQQQRFPTTIWDANGRRWKTRRPIGRVDTIKNAIRYEATSMRSTGRGMDAQSLASRHTTRSALIRHHQQQQRRASAAARPGMANVPNGVLGREQTRAFPGMHPSTARRTSLGSRFVVRGLSRAGSFSTMTGSEPSIMPPLVDDISPNDAADADDPGRGNVFLGLQEDAPTRPVMDSGYGVKMGCLTPFVEGILELTELDEESRRVIKLAVPLTIGAMAEPLFRLLTVAFISNYLGSNEMIAFLLVVLFARLTTEGLAGAIIDALSSFVQQALYSGESNAAFMAGQYVQLAVLLQIVLGVPLMVVWVFFMEDVVQWLVNSSEIAGIAHEYTEVIVFNYLIQAIGRTFTVVFHIYGHEHFESVIDFCSQAFSLIAIACMVSMKDGVDLTTVAYIQLFIGTATSFIKVIYPVTRGWMKPFRRGMVLSVALYHNLPSFFAMMLTTMPLLVGTFLEFGEWELLTIFLCHLGPAEVATWALLGNMWEILEASTEGIGEAASIRVAYLLSIPNASRAQKLANKVMYIAMVGSFITTSVLLMTGRHIAVLLTSDRTIQHLLNNTIALLGLANLAMAFAQVSWSLVGTQGRFRLAAVIMFFSRWLVTMPIALIAIFGFFLDLNAIAGSLVVGYATASCALCYVVLRSDWDRLAKVMQEMNATLEEGEDELAGLEGLDLEDFENDDDEDDDDDYDESSSSEGSSHL